MFVKHALHTLFSRMTGVPFSVHYWNDEQYVYGTPDSQTPPSFTLYFRSEPSFDAADPMVTLGEAYMDGQFDIEGDWSALTTVMDKNRGLLHGKVARTASFLASAYDKLRQKSQQKQNISHHYDIGNDFYAQWLDPTLSYSCAYFKYVDDNLETAQRQKIQHCLNKLDLEPHHRLLDIGCGWGALLIAAAEQFGIRGVGLTLSKEQFKVANQRIAERGLSERIEVRLMDYLDLDGEREQFDRVVSVGMFEHVGEAHIPRFFDTLQRIMPEGGRMLLHSIMSHSDTPTNAWSDKYIFPGGEIPYQPRVFEIMAQKGFFLLGQESLRLHYARTLDLWYQGFSKPDILAWSRQHYDERFVRMWMLYLQGCAASFRGAGLDVCQLIFTRGLNNQLPLTFASCYDGSQPERWGRSSI